VKIIYEQSIAFCLFISDAQGSAACSDNHRRVFAGFRDGFGGAPG
jgi:hypothetical protein